MCPYILLCYLMSDNLESKSLSSSWAAAESRIYIGAPALHPPRWAVHVDGDLASSFSGPPGVIRRAQAGREQSRYSICDDYLSVIFVGKTVLDSPNDPSAGVWSSKAIFVTHLGPSGSHFYTGP